MPPHLIFLTIPSPGLLLQKSPLSKHRVAQQQSTAWRDAGRLHCSATREREKHREKKKNQTSAGKGEAPALPEVLSRLCRSQGPGKTLAAAPSDGAGRGGGQCRVWCSRAVLNRGFH